MRKGLTLLVFLATLLGALFGLAAHALVHDPAHLDTLQQGLGLVTTLFLRAVKMLIAPLVLATLVSGVGRMGDAGDIGRVALKVMSWFVAASLVSLSMGLVMVETIAPGAGLHLTVAARRQRQRAEGAAHQPDPVSHQSGAHLDPGRHGAQRGAADRGLFAAGGRGAHPAGRKRQAVARLTEQLANLVLQMAMFVMNLAPHRGVCRGRGRPDDRAASEVDRQICLLCWWLLSGAGAAMGG